MCKCNESRILTHRTESVLLHINNNIILIGYYAMRSWEEAPTVIPPAGSRAEPRPQLHISVNLILINQNK